MGNFKRRKCSELPLKLSNKLSATTYVHLSSVVNETLKKSAPWDKIIESGEQKEKRLKTSEQSLNDRWDIINEPIYTL